MAPAELNIEDAVGSVHISMLPVLSAWQRHLLRMELIF